MQNIQLDVRTGNIIAFARLMVPQVLLFVLFLINLMSLPLPYVGGIKPMLVMMAVYYWAINRPTLVPPGLCFGMGLLMDILTGMPPGLNAFIFVAVQWLVRDQRRFLMGQPFITVWALFGLICVGAAGLQWILFGLVQGWAPLMPIAAGVAFSLFLFPFVTLLLVGSHRLLPGAARASYP